MDDHAFDCSTDDDELIDEEMMFYLEQEVETRLTMHGDENLNTTTSSRRFFESTSFQRDMEAMRPSNPVAQLLETDEGEEDAMPALPTFGTRAITVDESFGTFFSSTPSFATPAHRQGTRIICDESPSFAYYNGRRKRKYFDDSCCVTPPVRPMAKRVKSFSQDQLPKLPSLETLVGAKDTKILPPLHIFTPTPVTTDGGTFSAPVASIPMAIPNTINRGAPLPSLKIDRSAAIAIAPQSTFTMRSTASSPGARASKVFRTASDPTTTCMSAPNTTSSSLEYFCRRSLDISSPLRIRFRDLVVSSVGSVSSS